MALSAVSFIGILGLSGVVVNGSLVMVDFIDQKLGEGTSAGTSILEGAKGHFRPIMLTPVTTFLGFMPLILERAIQASFRSVRRITRLRHSLHDGGIDDGRVRTVRDPSARDFPP